MILAHCSAQAEKHSAVRPDFFFDTKALIYPVLLMPESLPIEKYAQACYNAPIQRPLPGLSSLLFSYKQGHHTALVCLQKGDML